MKDEIETEERAPRFHPDDVHPPFSLREDEEDGDANSGGSILLAYGPACRPSSQAGSEDARRTSDGQDIRKRPVDRGRTGYARGIEVYGERIASSRLTKTTSGGIVLGFALRIDEAHDAVIIRAVVTETDARPQGPAATSGLKAKRQAASGAVGIDHTGRYRCPPATNARNEDGVEAAVSRWGVDVGGGRQTTGPYAIGLRAG
ncbi:hypothetical protein R3P38DRAFT_3574495 [Favolaschia claudopus]|uniref:Uncharacterized protein n=1 Tax=Favolaschia claudopus TaxID=2862362 RepID=A0AAW0ANS4_9AGAR